MNKSIFKFFYIITIGSVFLVPKHAQAEAIECTIFKQVYESGYDVFYSTGGNFNAVRSSMDYECTRLPGNALALCRDIVATYFDVMLTLISQEIPPLEAALATNMCDTDTCAAGQTLRENRCVTCEQSYYKEGSGNGPCTPCPGIGRTLPGSPLAQDHDSITDCYISSGSDASGSYSFDNGKCNYSK